MSSRRGFISAIMGAAVLDPEELLYHINPKKLITTGNYVDRKVIFWSHGGADREVGAQYEDRYFGIGQPNDQASHVNFSQSKRFIGQYEITKRIKSIYLNYDVVTMTKFTDKKIPL